MTQLQILNHWDSQSIRCQILGLLLYRQKTSNRTLLEPICSQLSKLLNFFYYFFFMKQWNILQEVQNTPFNQILNWFLTEKSKPISTDSYNLWNILCSSCISHGILLSWKHTSKQSSLEGLTSDLMISDF